MSLLPSCTASAVEGSQYTEYFVPVNEVNASTIVYLATAPAPIGSITGAEVVVEPLSIPVSGVGTYSISVTLKSTTEDLVSTTDAVHVSITGNGTKEECKITGPQFFLGLDPTNGCTVGINGLLCTTVEDTTALNIIIVPTASLTGSYMLSVEAIASIKIA